MTADELHAKVGYTPLKPRYVIYSPTMGVFLGTGIYSKDSNAKTVAFAPTYEKEVDLSTFVADAELREVHPDLAGRHASKTAVGNAMLGVW